MRGEESRILVEEGAFGTIIDEEFVAALDQKWGPLLEGLPARSPQERKARFITAMLFENEARYLRGLTEETRAINVGSFTKYIFPILRRVFPNLIANEIVSTQPMTAPIGAVFYMDYIYGSNKGATRTGNVFPRDFDQDYTSEEVNGEILATGDGVKYGGGGAVLNANLAWNPVRPLDTTKGYSCVIKEVDATTGDDVQVATDDGSGGFTFNPTGGSVGGTINYSNGSVYGFSFQNIPANGNPIKAYYQYDGELNTKIPQVQFDVKKAAVEARPRRVKTVWSSEAAEDLRAFHGADAEGEMVSATAQELALEIDREVINLLFQNSTGTTGTFDRVPPGGISELDHLRALITVISTVSGLIHKKTLRAHANFIVTSPEVSAIITQLQTHGDYRPLWTTGDFLRNGEDMPRPMNVHGQFGVYKVGTLSNKWMVYEDPFFTRDMMLVGLRGAGWYDAGAAFAPYIPLQITGTFLDPSDFSFRKGLRTRYATKMLRSEYYGQIRIQNL